ncbi:serine/threonine protein kinase [Polyangium aurulentum]|uniref:serine/threonine protein kinase n=1 Tax=Polyangium aurulentum TaxID=2567896 RepID=UPI00146E118A|nr:serine/threonine-protein kinase [Polyangium aurulentum]UQA62062.1 serine/threonine protein kinase [Polyangium aurulentum]
MAAPDAGLLPTGKIFHDHYEVVRCISTGAMGAVYEVIDQKTLRRRALKVMLPSIVAQPEMRQRFKLEATITADIVSEHIVETFDADVDAATGAPFLVMELLRGDDLANVLGSRRRLEPREVVLILSQAARALDKTHAHGIVHRDLKPENIFITYRDDGSPRVKLLDFGIAKVAASTAKEGKQQTINLGTPPYMSPEQIMGEGTIDHRADLYALAHIAYALLVGEPYWLEESRKLVLYTLLLRICEGAKEPASVRAQRYGATLPPAFDAWFQKATALTPARRFDRASEQVLTLAEVLGVPLETRPVRASAPDWELDSLQLSRSGLWRLGGSASNRPAAMIESVGGPTGGRISAVPQGPRSEQSWARPDPTPHALPVTAPPPAKEEPTKRRALWLVALALVFVSLVVAAVLVKGVLVPSGAPSAAAPPEATTATAAVSPAPSPSVEAAAPAVASSASTRSASPAVPTSGRLPSAGKPRPTSTGTTTRKTQPSKPSNYDPLREL